MLIVFVAQDSILVFIIASLESWATKYYKVPSILDLQELAHLIKIINYYQAHPGNNEMGFFFHIIHIKMTAGKLQTYRLATIVSILVITPLGFASKFYDGPGAWWCNNYAGGILYEIFWCLVVYLLLPRAAAFFIAAAVFVVTCSLEFLQLWHPHFLEVIRGTFIGRTLIGTSFAWWDIPHYLVGCCAGWLCIKYLRNIQK